MDNQLQERKKELERELLKFDFSKRDTNIEMELSMLNDQIRVQEKESGLAHPLTLFYTQIRARTHTHSDDESSQTSPSFLSLVWRVYQQTTHLWVNMFFSPSQSLFWVGFFNILGKMIISTIFLSSFYIKTSKIEILYHCRHLERYWKKVNIANHHVNCQWFTVWLVQMTKM